MNRQPAVTNPAIESLWLGRHNWLAWAGLLAALLLLLFYWWHHQSMIQQQRQQIFDQVSQQMTSELEHRLVHIEMLLDAGVAFQASSQYVSQAEWQHFVQSQSLDFEQQGIQALGIVSYVPQPQLAAFLQSQQQPFQPRPAGERPFYALVSHIQPMTSQNRQVLGYDLLTDDMRRRTAMRAASLGQAAVTPRIWLQQDLANNRAPGLVMLKPVYRPDSPLLTAQQKLAALQGFVYAAFRVAELVPSAWRDQQNNLPDVKFSAGVTAANAETLFERQMPLAEETVLLATDTRLEWYGQPFWLHFNTNPAFVQTQLPALTYSVVFAGTLALLLLFWLLSFLNVRRFYAQRRCSELERQLAVQRQLLVQDEQRHSLALKACQLPWFEFDVTTGEAFYSDLWWRLMGYPLAQLQPTPQTFYDVLAPSSIGEFRQDLQRLMARGPELDRQHYAFVSRQGKTLWCLVRFYLVRDAEGNAYRLYGTVEDQTPLQQLQQRRLVLQQLSQHQISQALASKVPDNQAMNLRQQRQLHWLVHFFTAELAEPTLGTSSLSRLDDSIDPPLPALRTLLPQLIDAAEPSAKAHQLSWQWQEQPGLELGRQDGRIWWQLWSNVLPLVLQLARPQSQVLFLLEPWPGGFSWSVQLQTDGRPLVLPEFGQHRFAELPIDHSGSCLLALQFWADQLGAGFSFQQDGPALRLELSHHCTL